MTEEAKAARREYQREYRKKNADRIRETQRAWNQANPERCNRYVRNWRRNHPEAVAKINERYWMKKAEQMKRNFESDTKE